MAIGQMPDADAVRSAGRRRVPLVDPGIFGPLQKHSISVAGHATSIRIESLFWDALRADSHALGVPLNALVAEIDVQRLAADPPPNLASAIRLWVTARLRDAAESSA